MQNQEVKSQLLELCRTHLRKQKERICKTLDDIQVALKSETKSSAGDKHETGRAMLQLERENVGKQLAVVEQQEHTINRIQENSTLERVTLGTVVCTGKANYFISVAVGVLTLNGTQYYAIGIQSPIAQTLLGKAKGDAFNFRRTPDHIIELW